MGREVAGHHGGAATAQDGITPSSTRVKVIAEGGGPLVLAAAGRGSAVAAIDRLGVIRLPLAAVAYALIRLAEAGRLMSSSNVIRTVATHPFLGRMVSSPSFQKWLAHLHCKEGREKGELTFIAGRMMSSPLLKGGWRAHPHCWERGELILIAGRMVSSPSQTGACARA